MKHITVKIIFKVFVICQILLAVVGLSLRLVYIATAPEPPEMTQQQLKNELKNKTNIVNVHSTKLTSMSYPVMPNGMKSYMPFNIFPAECPQDNLQLIAHTGEYGIRKVCDRYCVAIGTAFCATIGDKIDIKLTNGAVIPAIVGDWKADKDTDPSHQIAVADGSVVEFIVDDDSIPRTVKRTGDFSYAKKEWNAPVEAIIVYIDE